MISLKHFFKNHQYPSKNANREKEQAGGSQGKKSLGKEIEDRLFQEAQTTIKMSRSSKNNIAGHPNTNDMPTNPLGSKFSFGRGQGERTNSSRTAREIIEGARRNYASNVVISVEGESPADSIQRVMMNIKKRESLAGKQVAPETEGISEAVQKVHNRLKRQMGEISLDSVQKKTKTDADKSPSSSNAQLKEDDVVQLMSIQNALKS